MAHCKCYQKCAQQHISTIKWSRHPELRSALFLSGHHMLTFQVQAFKLVTSKVVNCAFLAANILQVFKSKNKLNVPYAESIPSLRCSQKLFCRRAGLICAAEPFSRSKLTPIVSFSLRCGRCLVQRMHQQSTSAFWRHIGPPFYTVIHLLEKVIPEGHF